MTANFTAEDKFNAAVSVIQSLPKNGPFQPSQELMLRFYALFKHSRFGVCRAPRPAFWDVVGKAKWTAWSSLSGLSQEEAMLRYVEELKNVIETMPHTTEVSSFLETLGNFYETVEESGSLEGSYLQLSGSTPPIVDHSTLSLLPAPSVCDSLQKKPSSVADEPMLLTDSQQYQQIGFPPPDILCVGQQNQEVHSSHDDGDTCLGSAYVDEGRVNHLSPSSSDEEDVFCDSIDQDPCRDSILASSPLAQNSTTSNRQLHDAVFRLQTEVKALADRLNVLEDILAPSSFNRVRPSSTGHTFVSRFCNWFTKSVHLNRRTFWWLALSPLLLVFIHRMLVQKRLRQRGRLLL